MDQEMLWRGWSKTVGETLIKGEPYVVFRDGRLFPLEHTLADFIKETPHGRRVRRSIRKFREILYGYASEARYIGVVKTPRVEVLARVVLWYMKYGSKKDGKDAIWPDLDDRYVFRDVLPDQEVALLLFRGLSDKLKEGEVLVTCRFIRPFFSMNREGIGNCFKSHDALKEYYLDRLARSMNFEDVEEFRKLCDKAENYEDIIDTFADVSMRAAVMHFYVALPTTLPFKGVVKVNIPRYEALVDHRIIDDKWNDDEAITEERITKLEEFSEKAVRRLLKALSVQDRALDVYPVEELAPYQRERGDLIVPKVVREAHLLAKDAAKTLGYDVQRLIYKRLLTRLRGVLWRT